MKSGDTERMPRKDCPEMVGEPSYLARVAMEKSVYAHDERIHDLPAIHHYWSQKHLRPKLQLMGLTDEKHLFEKHLEMRCVAGTSRMQRFVSIGAGNCDLEIELTLRLQSSGHRAFVIDCVDLNPEMLARGVAAAAELGVADRIHVVAADFNEWNPEHEYDAVLANQSLHHVLKLEHLFDQIKGCLKEGGRFIVSDIIGRNGHQRWPEALQMVRRFWRRLPPSYRFNQKLHRYEEIFEDWDCSQESFEGIRSQDILQLLMERFHFHLFFAFGNIIEPFVDRHFGQHFDATAEWDRAFIDEVARRDEEEIRSGRIKPAHMMAVLANEAPSTLIHASPLTPEFCLRSPNVSADSGPPSKEDPYQWDAWPHDPRQELEIACRMLKGAEDRIRELKKDVERSQNLIRRFGAEVDRVNQTLEETVVWAQRLDKEVVELQSLVEERTAWAQKLDAEIADRTAWALRLQQELQESMASIQRLQQESDDHRRWALQLDEELRGIDWARRINRRWNKLRSTIGSLFVNIADR